MKNAFYFMLKAIFFLKIFKYFSQLCWSEGKQLSEKVKVNSSQSVQQTVTMHILPCISRSKVNQTMRFVQVIEYKMRNILLKKSFTKCVGEASPRPFYEKMKIERISGSAVWNVINLFLFYQVEVHQNILNEVADHLLLSYIKLF